MPRYINLDELLTSIGKRNGRLPLWLDEILMEDCKVADVEPVKRGEWISINSVSRCSNCEYIPPYDRAIDDIFYSAYCPNCGAKMENSEVIK